MHLLYASGELNQRENHYCIILLVTIISLYALLAGALMEKLEMRKMWTIR